MSGENEVRGLRHELSRQERVVGSLQEELKKKEEIILKLTEELDELTYWKQNVQQGNIAAIVQHRHDANAQVALSIAELNLQANNQLALSHKIRELEESLGEKDSELRRCLQRTYEVECESQTWREEKQRLSFELKLQKKKAEDLREDYRNQTEAWELQSRVEKEQSQIQQNENDSQTQQLIQHLHNQIHNLTHTTRSVQHKYDHAQQLITSLQAEIRAKDDEVAKAGEEICRISAKYEAMVKSGEIEVLTKNQALLRKRLNEQLQIIEALEEDSLILQRVRVEKAAVEKECADLKARVARQSERGGICALRERADNPDDFRGDFGRDFRTGGEIASYTGYSNKSGVEDDLGSSFDTQLKQVLNELCFRGYYEKLDKNGLYIFQNTKTCLKLLNGRIFAHLVNGKIISLPDFLHTIYPKYAPQPNYHKPTPMAINPFDAAKTILPQGMDSLRC